MVVEVGTFRRRRSEGSREKYSAAAGLGKRRSDGGAKRRLPTWSSAPASASRGDVELARRGSPSSFTPPWSISRRASRGRGDAERRDEERRQVHRVAAGQRDLGHLLGRLAAARTTRVNAPRRPRAASSPCERATIEARERELRTRIGSPPAAARASATSRHHSASSVVGDPHRPAEHLLGRRRRAGCCCRPTSSSSRRPRRAAAASSARPAARGRSAASPRARRAGCRAGRCRRARRRPRSRPSRRPASADRGARRPRSARCAANRFAKSSRSSSRATVIVRASRTTSAYVELREPLAVVAHLGARRGRGSTIACSR